VVVTGKTAGGEFQREVKVEPGLASPENEALRFLWARERIQRLSDYQRVARGEDTARVKEITDLGLKYNLMTAYTSFVAVDKVKRGDGTMETVKQPLPLPEGVSDLAVGDGGSYVRKMGVAPRIPHAEFATSGPLGFGSASRPPAPQPAKEQDKEKPVGLKIKVLKVQGKLEEAQVQQALEAKLQQLEDCYRKARKDGCPLLTQVTLKITIAADGKVAVARGGHTAAQPSSLAKCLMAALQQVAFPKPAEGQAEVEVQLSLPGAKGASG
jgi:Ca-activated chloride channel family protein